MICINFFPAFSSGFKVTESIVQCDSDLEINKNWHWEANDGVFHKLLCRIDSRNYVILLS